MDDQREDGLCYGVGSIGNNSQRFAAYNLGDLKREEDVLLNLYTKVICFIVIFLFPASVECCNFTL